ncbi:MAG: hypothetical protein HY815_04095 [Candidatus Riflebacteria bacterium]|nr:hypothetical protein [Candidatus Riflebacteria bacterium]
MQKRTEIALVVVVLAVHCIVAWTLCYPRLPVADSDPSRYYVLAEELVSESTYRVKTVPPGFSLTLVPWIQLLGPYPASVQAVRIQCILLTALGLVLGHVYARKVLGLEPPAALGCLAAVALAPPVLELAGMVMSEPLFLVLFYATLLVARREPESWRSSLLLGPMLFVGFWVRTIHVCLFPGLVVWAVVRKRWTVLTVTVLSGCVALGSWAVWVSRADEGQQTYVKELFSRSGEYNVSYEVSIRPVIGHLGTQIESLVAHDLPEVVLPILASQSVQELAGSAFRSAVWLVLGVCLSLVLVRGASRAVPAVPELVVALVVYQCIVCCWWYEPKRFEVAVLHPLWLLVVLGLRARPRALAVLLVLSTLGSLASVTHRILKIHGTGHPLGREAASREGEIADAYEWLRRSSKPGDVVLTRTRPWQLTLATKLKTGQLPVFTLEFVRSRRGRWLFLLEPDCSAAVPVLDREPAYRRAWVSGTGRVAIYSVTPP